MVKRFLLLVVAMFVMGLPFANATAQLFLQTGVNSVTVIDVGNTGQITFVGPLGHYIVNATTGVSKPISGAATSPKLDLSSLNVTNSVGGTITIKFTDTNFVGPLAGNFRAAIGGTTAGTVTFTTYLDAGNVPFGQGTLLTPTVTFSPVSFSGTFFSAGILPPLTNYSLTQVITITQAGARQATSFDANLEAVPEPSALLLLGSGLSALGIWRLKRR